MWKKLFFLKPDKGLNIEKCTNWGIFDFFDDIFLPYLKNVNYRVSEVI